MEMVYHVLDCARFPPPPLCTWIHFSFVSGDIGLWIVSAPLPTDMSCCCCAISKEEERKKKNPYQE